MSTPNLPREGILDIQDPAMEHYEALQGVTANISRIALAIDSVKKNVVDDRTDYINKRMEDNRAKMAESTTNHRNLSKDRLNMGGANGNGRVNLLQQRMQEAVAKQNGADIGSSSVYLFKPKINTINVHNIIQPTVLPKAKRLPRYTTWRFIKRNELMTEDQSIAGQPRIYYDQNEVEPLICSDSEEELNDEEDEKKDFVESEDKFIRSVIEQAGSSDDVYDLLAQELSRKPCKIKARYEDLVSGRNAKDSSHLDKTLEEATNSFNKLFCRRCLIFNCKLHGCSQDLIIPAERRSTKNNIDEELVSSEPCGPHCYLHVQPTTLSTNASGVLVTNEKSSGPSLSKRLKSHRSGSGNEEGSSSPPTDSGDQQSIGSNDPEKSDKFVENKQARGFETWRTLEKSLFETGQERFGKNSCLIAIIMCGLKTCVEVFNALQENENKGDESNSDDNCSTTESSEKKGTALRKKLRSLRRRSKARRLKFTRVKSAGSHSMRKSFSENNNLNSRQYSPCGCLSICGDNCSCFANGTVCEKYCRCPKNCQHRYKGCFCGKGQCRTHQCPCFAINRECDPDVCRNCWVSCGDGTVVKNINGANYECDNMKLLLRQHQRILLGTSDVSGFGAFIWNDVPKDTYLGEYNGELISHREADRRGKIYDRGNCSYLFNLNDQYVIDACRMSNKLKFVNHSSNPNCYAKVMMVKGDHRVGIYAKQNLKAGEELFLDYMYESDKAPDWAKKPGDSGPGNDDCASSTNDGAKKLA